MKYGSIITGQTTKEKIDQIQTIQNRLLKFFPRKISVSPQISFTKNCLY